MERVHAELITGRITLEGAQIAGGRDEGESSVLMDA